MTDQDPPDIAAIVLLDDGTSTEQVSQLRLKPDAAPSRSWASTRVDQLRGNPKLACPNPPHITFFTFFKDLKIPERDTGVLHSFEALRARKSAQPPLDETWFVGTPFVESFGYPIEMYLECLRSLRARFGHVVYIPHRHESQENIARYRDEAGLRVRSLGMSIEAHLLVAAGPKCLVTTASSVVETIPAIVGCTMRLISVRLPMNGLSAFTRKEIEQCYRLLANLRNGTFELIDLTP